MQNGSKHNAKDSSFDRYKSQMGWGPEGRETQTVRTEGPLNLRAREEMKAHLTEQAQGSSRKFQCKFSCVHLDFFFPFLQ